MPGCRPCARGTWVGIGLGGLLALASPRLWAEEEPAAPAQGAPAPAAPAPAPPSAEDMAKAKLHYQSGAALYEAGKYQAAREAFEESYRLSRLPDLLFNLSSVARKLGRTDEAIGYLERYLAARPDAADRKTVEADIASLRAEKEAADKAASDEAAKKAADKVALDQALKDEPPPAPLRRWPPWPALGLAGGGVVLLITGIGVGGAALAAAKTVDGGATFDRALHERGQAMEKAAIALDVLGGLALAGGAAWTAVWWWKGRKQHEALRVVPQGAGLSLQGRF